MPTDLVWKNKVYPNFKTLLDTTLSGLTYNSLRESDQVELANNLSSSCFNGSYSVQISGIRSIDMNVNSVQDFSYEIGLQVQFELNKNAGRASYHKAVNDVETIIKHRLDPSTYEGTLLTVSFLSMRKPLYKNTNTFISFEIIFLVTGRIIF